MHRLASLLAGLGLITLALPAEVLAESRHVLKGRIIRALAIEPTNPDHVVVGQKGRKAGSGLVFKSLDGGKSWRTQNGNAPLSPAATDVVPFPCAGTACPFCRAEGFGCSRWNLPDRQRRRWV